MYIKEDNMNIRRQVNRMYNDTLFRSLDIGEGIEYHQGDSIKDKFLIQ